MNHEKEMLAALLSYLGGNEFGSVEWEIKMGLILVEAEYLESERRNL